MSAEIGPISPARLIQILNALALAGVNVTVSGDVGQIHQNAAFSAFTIEESPIAIVEGQVTLTGVAQNFPADPCKSITIENPSTNAVVVVRHDNALTLLNGYRLQPGATVSMAIDNANRIWVIGTVAQIISYIGVN